MHLCCISEFSNSLLAKVSRPAETIERQIESISKRDSFLRDSVSLRMLPAANKKSNKSGECGEQPVWYDWHDWHDWHAWLDVINVLMQLSSLPWLTRCSSSSYSFDMNFLRRRPYEAAALLFALAGR